MVYPLINKKLISIKLIRSLQNLELLNLKKDKKLKEY